MAGEVIADADLLMDVVRGFSEGFSTISEELRENSRWHTLVRTVFRRHADGKLFIADWHMAATEYQDSKFPEIAREGESYTETVTKYRVVR